MTTADGAHSRAVTAAPATASRGRPAIVPAADGPTTVEGLRQEIEHTRAELGETVQALTAKADVKARLHDSAEEAKSRVRARVHEVVDGRVPESAQQLAARAARTANLYRTPLLLLATAGVIAALVIRWQRGRVR